MQKLTQFAGSSQILGGYGKNTDGHQALKGLRRWATTLPLCLHAQRSSRKVLLVQRCRSVRRKTQESAARQKVSQKPGALKTRDWLRP